jgi:hypothetical protein
MPIEAVTDRPAIETTVLEGLVVSDGVGIIVVFSAPEDDFDCETIVGFMVCDVVGDALDDVALFVGFGMIWSNVGAKEGGPDEHPTQYRQPGKMMEDLYKNSDIEHYLVTRTEEEAIIREDPIVNIKPGIELAVRFP